MKIFVEDYQNKTVPAIPCKGELKSEKCDKIE
jgi:hypothetical protein